MEKYENMVQAMKVKSEKMTNKAMEEMDDMFKKKEKISVSELMKRTGLSRSFFYNNLGVKEKLYEYRKLQDGQVLVNPKAEAIAKAQELRIKSLEEKVSKSVPISQYEDLLDKYKELKNQYKKIEKGAFMKAYESL